MRQKKNQDDKRYTWKTGESYVAGLKGVDKRAWFCRYRPKLRYNSKEAGREAQFAEGLCKNCRENMPPSLRLIRGFCNKYHWFSSGGPLRVG